MSAQDTISVQIREAADESLLKTFAALTHSIHATRDYSHEIEYRRQRGLVETEILRRMRESQHSVEHGTQS